MALSSPVVWFTLDDLPVELFGDKLVDWLEQKAWEQGHGNKRVLIEGYLALFTQLPDELLVLVASFCSREKCALLSTCCTQYNTLLSPIFYRMHRDSPFSPSEVIKALR